MHLIVGFARLMVARVLATVYSLIDLKMVGRKVIRLCCAAYTADAGLDEIAVEIVRGPGREGRQLITEEADKRGARSIAALILRQISSTEN